MKFIRYFVITVQNSWVIAHALIHRCWLCYFITIMYLCKHKSEIQTEILQVCSFFHETATYLIIIHPNNMFVREQKYFVPAFAQKTGMWWICWRTQQELQQSLLRSPGTFFWSHCVHSAGQRGVGLLCKTGWEKLSSHSHCQLAWEGVKVFTEMLSPSTNRTREGLLQGKLKWAGFWYSGEGQ